jgi:hypothetical protein
LEEQHFRGLVENSIGDPFDQTGWLARINHNRLNIKVGLDCGKRGWWGSMAMLHWCFDSITVSAMLQRWYCWKTYQLCHWEFQQPEVDFTILSHCSIVYLTYPFNFIWILNLWNLRK